MIFGNLLLAGMALVRSPTAMAETLNLLCFGQGEKLESRSSPDLVWDSDTQKYRTRDSIRTDMRGFDTAVTIQIQDDQGRIRLPRQLVPPLHGGGDGDGWWTLVDLRLSPDDISAAYKLNGLNHPKLKIDRTTGMITIKGFGQDFSGRCDRVDSGQRRF